MANWAGPQYCRSTRLGRPASAAAASASAAPALTQPLLLGETIPSGVVVSDPGAGSVHEGIVVHMPVQHDTGSTLGPSVCYVKASAGSSSSLFVRSDGVVAYTYGRGKIHGHVQPSTAGVLYSDASIGDVSGYLLRRDGAVDRVRADHVSWGVRQQIYPPPGKRFTAVESGPHASYLVVNDGTVARTRGGGRIDLYMEPPARVQYIQVSCGPWCTYMLRSDGSVDRTRGGKVTSTIYPPPGGITYTAVSACDSCVYLLRSDGAVDRSARGCSRAIAAVMLPAGQAKGTRYVALSRSRGYGCTYLVRDDGKIDRAVSSCCSSNGVQGTLAAPAGRVPGACVGAAAALLGMDGLRAHYLEASAGPWSSYLVRDDGGVAVTSHGRVRKVVYPTPSLTASKVAYAVSAAAVTAQDKGGSRDVCTGGPEPIAPSHTQQGPLAAWLATSAGKEPRAREYHQ